jgi:hypothetical protein
MLQGMFSIAAVIRHLLSISRVWCKVTSTGMLLGLYEHTAQKFVYLALETENNKNIILPFSFLWV